MITEHLLDKPKVRDLIAVLKTYPQDSAIIMQDADTLWDITKIHIGVEINGTIVLWGKYPEMSG